MLTTVMLFKIIILVTINFLFSTVKILSKFASSDYIFLLFSAGQFEQQVRRGDQQVDEVVDRHQEVQGNL